MAADIDPAHAQARLRRLWKGTLFVGIAGGYALLLALLFVHHGWRPALLALFVIAVAQFFRYIAGDVDRIGWNLAKQRGDDADGDPAARYQTRLLGLLFVLTQLLAAALAYQAFDLGGLDRALATLAVLLGIEAAFWQIRKVDRQVEFEQASYGQRDRGPLFDVAAPPREPSRETERKLDALRQMVDDGLVSEKAYRKACDRYRVRSVMEEPSG